MAHSDIIIDSGSHFKIDPFTRTIERADNTPLVLVQGDHNSERISFDIPRYVDGHDMSICGRVEVHYTNKDTKNTQSNSDVYMVNDLTANDEDTVTFTWLVRNTATVYAGTLEFSIKFICFDSETAEVVYTLNTAKFKNIVVSEGCSCTESEAEPFEDLFKSWENSAKEDAKAYIDECINGSVAEALEGEY